MVALAAASDSASPPKVVKKKTSSSSKRIHVRGGPVSSDSGMPLGDRLGEASQVPATTLEALGCAPERHPTPSNISDRRRA